MKINDRNARRMMERMGINQKEVPEVEEVIIRTRQRTWSSAARRSQRSISRVTGSSKSPERSRRSPRR